MNSYFPSFNSQGCTSSSWFWWFSRFVVEFCCENLRIFSADFFGLYPFLDVWELVAHISFLYLVGCVSFTYIYLYLNVVLWELVVLYFYFYLIWKIGCTYIYLHLNVVVRELFTDFPQVGHHRSLLHSGVHLWNRLNQICNIISTNWLSCKFDYQQPFVYE